jgi:glycosyltransferase involved in cell wall biosynthesis
MSRRPSIGVVVAVRNGVGHLARALDRVLEQVPAPVDVLVIDGGSTDGSAELAAGIAGVRVVAQDGRGLGAARNQALAAVRGELVAFCDADDHWTHDSLALRMRHLVDHADCDAVIGRVVTATLEEEDVPAGHVERLGVPLPGHTPGALLARREVFDAVGPFDEDMRIGSDSDWFVRLHLAGCRLDLIDDVVLVKGVRTSSLSADVETYRRELLGVARAYITRRRSGA